MFVSTPRAPARFAVGSLDLDVSDGRRAFTAAQGVLA